MRPLAEPLEGRTLLTYGYGWTQALGGPNFDGAHAVATDSGGNYTLHVAPGTYTVRFHPTADSLVQSPFDPGQSITVVAGQLVTGVNFSELVV